VAILIDNLVLVESNEEFVYADTPPIIIDNKMSFEGVLFETGATKITQDFSRELIRLSIFLSANSQKDLTIIGHTDNSGEDSGNQQLSLQRSSAVKEFLVSLNIEPGRIKTIGKGSTEPLVPNSSTENRAKNRRVEIVIE
jgi:outer membrane protein OmpA-like peptidoglycan-associated protein